MSQDNKVSLSKGPTLAERPVMADMTLAEALFTDVELTTVKAQALYDEKIRVMNASITFAITEGYCGEVLNALNAVYPDGSPWSDGEWRTTEGYNLNGRDWEGYNSEGYDQYGYNREGQRRAPSCTCSLCR